jgi:hypothetical protein
LKRYPAAEVEQMMKLQDVLLKASLELLTAATNLAPPKMACPGFRGLVGFGSNPKRSRRVSTQQAESLRHIMYVPASRAVSIRASHEVTHQTGEGFFGFVDLNL